MEKTLTHRCSLLSKSYVQASPKPIRSFTPESHEGSQSANSSEITNINPGINLDFEENSTFQEGVILEA